MRMNYEEMAVTVSDLNSYIKKRIDDDEALNTVIVKGEISNFKNHYTGHWYFTLKDEKSLIKCVMFRSYAERVGFIPKDGAKVIVFGQVAVFERDGIYQIYVKAMNQDGKGDLYAAYEKLKNDLEKQGLFDQKYKKPIPLMPKVIGVLTDIINVSTRRNPNTYIRLFPVPVQGKTACLQIARGIKLMNENKLADVIILARGGGSLEDLWPFNEEVVARAIFESEIPIISAVGHETDFTIADFVADLRAPTPSAAAELANPDVFELKEKINSYKSRARLSLKKKLDLMNLKYEKIISSKSFSDPLRSVNDNYVRLDNGIRSMQNSVNLKYKEAQMQFSKVVSSLDALSPLKTLSRGYSIVEKDGNIVNSINMLEKDDIISLRLMDGKRVAKII